MPFDVDMRFLPVRHPESSDKVPAFDDAYSPMVRMTYALREERPRRIFLPDAEATPRRCAVCGETEPRVTFNEVSHVVAACLGNRTWVSREECDDCNHTFSRHEDELANMLSASRVIGRVRTRNGTAKVKAPGGRGSVGGGAFDGPVIVNVHANDPSVKIDWSEDKTMKLTFHQPGHRPFLAIRSVVRSCWLGMTPDQRARHPYLLDVVTGALDPDLNEYVDVTIFDGLYSHVMLEAWESNAEAGRARDVAPFAFRLCFVNRVLIWTCPDPSTRLHVPSPLPPVPLAMETGSARGKLHRGPSNARFDAGTVTHAIVYEQRIRGTEVGATPPRPKPIRIEQDARLELENSSGTKVIGRTEKTLYDVDLIDRRMTVRFAGHDLAGSICIRSRGDTFDVTALLDITGHTTAECRQSHDFLGSMLNNGGRLKVVTSTGEMVFPIQPSDVPYSDDEIDGLLDDLAAIEEEFDVTFVVPRPVPDDDVRLVRFLGAAIRDRRVATEAGDLTITLLPTATDDTVTALAGGQNISVDTVEDFVIFGHTLPPVRHKTTFVAPRLAEGTVDDILRRLRDGQEVPVRFSVAEIVHTFPLGERRAA